MVTPLSRAPALAVEPESGSDYAMRVMTTVAVTVVFTQKIAMPGSGGALQIAPVLYYGAMVLLMFKGHVRIAPMRFALFSATVGVAALCQAVYHGNRFSIGSFGFYVVIYASCIFVLPAEEKQYLKLLSALQNVGVFGGVFVLIDLLAQRAGMAPPNLEKIIPSAVMLKDFAYIRAVSFGSSQIKPNGLIFLEPSHCSQFLAFCLFAELCLFRRPWRVLFYFATMFLTNGGTGMLLVLLTAPFAVMYFRPGVSLGLGALVVVGLIGAISAGFLDSLLARLEEFGSEKSSAHYRFVAPVQMMAAVLEGPTLNALVGVGAGNAPKQNPFVIWVPLAKTMYEYGLVFVVFWFPLTIISTFGQGRIFIMSWMMFMQYHILNGSLLVPINFIYTLLFGGLYVLRGSDDAHHPERAKEHRFAWQTRTSNAPKKPRKPGSSLAPLR
jgi:hypothetical protein